MIHGIATTPDPSTRGPSVRPASSRSAVRFQREPAGLWAARRGSYRVVYEIDDEAAAVTVLRIDHRADIYRRR
ncbi:MAG: type II toxin-antitoxin system RelE/ParE family toxin [Acidimicrobiales bacterium]